MSGTLGFVLKEQAEAEAAAQVAAALSVNRATLLEFVGEWLKAKYGETAFYTTHPLVTAINASAAGMIVDLQQLQNDCVNWQFPAEGGN